MDKIGKVNKWTDTGIKSAENIQKVMKMLDGVFEEEKKKKKSGGN